MKNLLLPVIAKKFIDAVGKTAIECNNNGQVLTVWANGDKSMDMSLLCNITVNEPGDTFTATKDSKQLDDKGNPIYLAGDVVTRSKMSYEFKSFAGNNTAAQFAQSASAFGLQLQVVMQA